MMILDVSESDFLNQMIKVCEKALNFFYIRLIRNFIYYIMTFQGCRSYGGQAHPPPDFGRSVNLIQTRGADYAPHIITSPQKAIYTSE